MNVIFLVLIVALSGCVHIERKPRVNFNVEVSALSGVQESNAKYKLLPGNKDVDENDLQFKEYAQYVHRALNNRGFVMEENLNKAEIVVFLTYGVGEPVTSVESYAVPTFGQTGYSSAYTTGRVNMYGGYSQNTTLVPQYGITGSRTEFATNTNYNRYLAMSAFSVPEFKKNKKRVELWQVSVTSKGPGDDLRRVFPVLAAASRSYINTNTDSKLKFTLEENDPEVLSIKGIKVSEELKNNEGTSSGIDLFR